QFRQRYPRAGFIWLGFPDKELPAAKAYVSAWPATEQEALLLLGNIPHNEFLTLLGRCSATIRTPACDGVSASVLESLALGVPVLASENGHRPAGVMTYREGDAEDLCRGMAGIPDRARTTPKSQRHNADDNIALTADCLLAHAGGRPQIPEKSLVHAY